ncbi:MAG: 30S ribosomal protein S19e [Candidatus Micrarchaeaceae archaeon]
MSNIYEVDAQRLVEEVAKKLKEQNLAKPEYIGLVKSGAGRERVPSNEDFWYVRSASLLRRIYINGPVGISRLRTYFGNRKKHRSVIKHHHYKASGSILTDSLNSLERLGYVAKTKSGRIITPKGRSLLDKTANELAKT